MNILSPKEAFNLLKSNANAIMVDVRTDPEWQNGVANLEECYNSLQQITININQPDSFSAKLQANVLELATPLLFICRSGVRSQAAAELAESLGYMDCYNVRSGFNGWVHEGLPCK